MCGHRAAWLHQLKPNGWIVAPLRYGHLHPVCRIRRHPREAAWGEGRIETIASFMPIQGRFAQANPWQSYLMGGVRSAVESRYAPSPAFPTLEEGVDPIESKMHCDFYFFLSLACRELWKTNNGYGIADPATGCAALTRADGFSIRTPQGMSSASARLYDRLQWLISEWQRIGRPAITEYVSTFIPKREIPTLSPDPFTEWVIERTDHWEVVRCSHSSISGSGRRTCATT